MITNKTILSNTMRNRINELDKEIEALRKLVLPSDEFFPDIYILLDNLNKERAYLRKQLRRY